MTIRLKMSRLLESQKAKTWKNWPLLLFLAKPTWVDFKRDLLCSIFYFFIIYNPFHLKCHNSLNDKKVKA